MIVTNGRTVQQDPERAARSWMCQMILCLMKRRPTEAADAWEAVGRDSGVRIPPVRLAQLDTFTSPADRDHLTGSEADLLAAGMATHHRAIRSRRTVRAAVSLLMAMTAFTAATAWKQRRMLHSQRLA
ncbi:hypothetical protein [Streptomyces sp. NPDC005989]|uniref:hypothetical protein n=1 Tax=Streptomyces sp. NPDC005989 TaxID=3156727 RepID=UPI0033CAD616